MPAEGWWFALTEEKQAYRCCGQWKLILGNSAFLQEGKTGTRRSPYCSTYLLITFERECACVIMKK